MKNAKTKINIFSFFGKARSEIRLFGVVVASKLVEVENALKNVEFREGCLSGGFGDFQSLQEYEPSIGKTLGKTCHKAKTANFFLPSQMT